MHDRNTEPYRRMLAKRLTPQQDRRVKVSEEKREEIKTLYTIERLPQREIARRTGVSRRMISFILFPERLEHAKALYKKRRKDGRYYDKERHRQAMASTRHYKRTLFKNQ